MAATRVLLSSLLWLLMAYVPPGFAESSYQTGKEKWVAGDYAAALTALLEFRKQAFGRTAEVDYMLGTSACRLPARQEWGLRVLNFTLYNYALDDSSRQQVQTELQKCQQAGLSGERLAVAGAIHAVLVAGASGQGKMYYDLGSENSLFAYPARHVREIAEAEFSARLFTPQQLPEAKAKISSLVPEFTVHGYGRFVLASHAGHSVSELEQLATKLDRYFAFLQQRYAITAPTSVVSVYLVPTVAELQQLAERLHGLAVNPNTIGYTYRNDQSAVAMVTGVNTGTLFHELFHLSVRNGFGDIPQWLDEGIASLYEVSTFRQQELFGLVNWRGELLKRFSRDIPPVAKVISSDWFPFDVQELERDRWQDGQSNRELAVQMAANRYFILYLQEQGKLTDVYRSFRDRDLDALADNPHQDALKRVEQVLGKPMSTIEAEFGAWLKQVLQHGLPAPAGTGETATKSGTGQKP
ncbi:hypothetical protein HPT27_13790 [Permianibacter sp. IMCC34836]|uniref:hypothetical protein n=1 Tax=Permianibacter fluminis TaxID=2738515 RepID=UPI001553B63A|nr:hypothetical protein [Permianibacter fluminis]NQD38100.1 hypothetical protein [Permianibacter fluminis]